MRRTVWLPRIVAALNARVARRSVGSDFFKKMKRAAEREKETKMCLQSLMASHHNAFQGPEGIRDSPGFAWHTLASVKTLGYCRAFYVLECREMWISEFYTDDDS